MRSIFILLGLLSWAGQAQAGACNGAPNCFDGGLVTADGNCDMAGACGEALNAIMLPSSTQTGAVYYFSTAGNDTTGDGSYHNPWLTFSKMDSECGGNECIILASSGTYTGADLESGTTSYAISMTYSDGNAGEIVTYIHSEFPAQRAKIICDNATWTSGSGIFNTQTGPGWMVVAGMDVECDTNGVDIFDATGTGRLLVLNSVGEGLDVTSAAGSQVFTGHDTSTIVSLNSDGTNIRAQVAASTSTADLRTTAIHIGGKFSIIDNVGNIHGSAVEPLGGNSTYLVDMELTAHSSQSGINMSGILWGSTTCGDTLDVDGCNIYAARTVIHDVKNTTSSTKGHGIWDQFTNQDVGHMELHQVTITDTGGGRGLDFEGKSSHDVQLFVDISGLLMDPLVTGIGVEWGSTSYHSTAGNEIVGTWEECVVAISSNVWRIGAVSATTFALFNDELPPAAQALLTPCTDAASVASNTAMSDGGITCAAGAACEGSYTGQWKFTPGDNDVNFVGLPTTLLPGGIAITSFSGGVPSAANPQNIGGR